MSKNFNLKVKNSQLAAVLKQKSIHTSEKSTPKNPVDEKKADKKEEVSKESELKTKVIRKAKAGPSVYTEEKSSLAEEEKVFQEQEPTLENIFIDPSEQPPELQIVEEVSDIKEFLDNKIEEEAPLVKEEIKEVKEEKKPSYEELRKIEFSKPIEERTIIKKDKYERPTTTKKPFEGNNRNFAGNGEKKPYQNGFSKTPFKPAIPPKAQPQHQVQPQIAPKERKVEEKKKKGMDSYKRQAFSRVFDQRDLLSAEESWKRRRNKKNTSLTSTDEIVRPKNISVKIPISLKELASELKIKASEVIQKLFLAGFPITINDILEDVTTIELIGNEFNCEIKIDTALEDKLQITDKSLKEEISETNPANLEKRPTVVTIMGHVDHGKTSIIDAFRKSNLTSGEAGAITQHIGAFICHTDHGSFTVIDTPGHEAFTAIRARGATVTDIIVLVIAGDEGIKPQTEEAIAKAKDANVPILVAINKCDKQGFNAENIYNQLANKDLLPEAWGGHVITVNCSATTGEGISQLAEMIALQSELLELKANPRARARGTVLESELHKGLGVTATLLVQNGTLRIGDAIVFEHEWGKTKTLQNEFGKMVESASPSTPVKVTGLSGVPAAGNDFIVVGSEKEARTIAEQRKSVYRQMQLKKAKSRNAQNMFDQKVEDMQKKTINIIVKADVGGSLEALKDSLLKIPTDKVIINFVHSDVGQIGESDIDLAANSKSIILGFHTKVEPHAESLVKQKKVKIILKDIIYHMIDEVKVEMQKLLDKIRHEEHLATAKVLAIFKSSRLGNIAGSIVTHGVFKRNYLAKLKRNGEVLFSGSIGSLKRMHDDVKEVKKDTECGILLNGFNDFKEGDEIEGYEISYLEQQL